MKITWLRANFFALAIIAIVLLMNFPLHAIPAPAINCVIEPGAGCGPTPASWVIYNDGSTTLAAKGTGGGNPYSGSDPTVIIQDAFNDVSCSSGCEVYVKSGTYALTIQITSGLSTYSNAGLQLATGQSLVCENPKTTIFTAPVIPAPAANGYYAAIVNKHESSSDSFISVQNCGFNLQTPTNNGVGLKAWESAMSFAGANKAKILNNWVTAGSIEFRCNTTVATTSCLDFGENFDNIVSGNIIEKEAGSSTFTDGTNNIFSQNVVNGTWDDGFLVGSGGINEQVVDNIFNNTDASGSNFASSDGAIRVENDGSVIAFPNETGIRDTLVWGNEIWGNYHTRGEANCIIVRDSAHTILAQNLMTGCKGTGIRIEDSLKTIVRDNQIYRNTLYGVHIIAVKTGTFGFAILSGNVAYDNGGASGFRLESGSAGMNLGNLTFTTNIAYDDKSVHTQNFFLTTALAGTLDGLYMSQNNAYQSPSGFVTLAGAGILNRISFSNNPPYNPVGKFANPFYNGNRVAPWGTASAPSASATYTIDGVDDLVTSTGGTGVSITISCGGTNIVSAAATLTNQLIWKGCTLTFGAFSGAPTVTVVGN